MIFDAPDLTLPAALSADLCVVGSGPGGLSVAAVAAEAGLRVVVLEAGELITPAQMAQREEAMFPRLYWDGASRTTSDRWVRIHQGKGVGGSSLHNFCLCKRIPASIRARWRACRGMESLPEETWNALYDEVEQLLSVAPVPRAMWNRHNLLLERGCQSLGWAGGGLSHNRTGCIGSGFCELGCAYDGKNNALKVLTRRAVEAGAQILTCCQATHLAHRKGDVQAVDAVAVRPVTHAAVGRVRVSASRVCLSASATATAALLLRSRVPDPSETTGRSLHVHPAVIAAGELDEPVRAWIGVPQSYECTELLDLGPADGASPSDSKLCGGRFGAANRRVWILPAFAHPAAAAIMLPGHGAVHRSFMERYANMAVLTAMVHDQSRGRVAPDGDLGLSIDYWPDAADREQLMQGLWACAHLLFAAGARRVLIPSCPPRVIERGEPYDDLRRQDLTRGLLDVTAVHPMATVPCGDDPGRAAVSSAGRHHHLRGLWVADGSLFPTSIGVPPQLSVYALGMHVGRQLVAAG